MLRCARQLTAAEAAALIEDNSSESSDDGDQEALLDPNDGSDEDKLNVFVSDGSNESEGELPEPAFRRQHMTNSQRILHDAEFHRSCIYT